MPTADPIPPAPLAAQLIGTDTDLVFVASDEQRAAAIAAIAARLAPHRVVAHVPSSDALPGDEAPASPANVGARVAALRRVRAAVAEGSRVLMVTTAEATAVRYPPPEAFDTVPPTLAQGDKIDLDRFATDAEALGYIVDDRIDEPGEIAVRGRVADIFPVDHDTPVRVEVCDGRITALRRYDPVTQRTTDDVCRIEVGRAVEPSSKGGPSLLAHVPGAGVAADPLAIERRDRFLAISAERGRRGRGGDTLIDAASWQREVETRSALAVDQGDAPPPRFVERRAPLRALARFVASAGGVLVVAGSARDLRFLAPRLVKATKREWATAADWTAVLAARPGTALLIDAPVERGFSMQGVAVIAAADLLGARAGGEVGAAPASGAMFGEAGELAVGDIVVHEDFGLGVVQGIEQVADGDALVLGYAREGKRLVPVAEADRVWRYGGDADAVQLDALDGSSWQRRRGAIDQAVAESARTLSALAEDRQARTTAPIAPDAAAFERFSAGFGFTETADQARAIAAVRADLASGTPMDRLVVGDVGYGKTEVALRAAALAALAGRQVAVAAPTTVLVRQHLETFQRRFEGTGIEVAGLSRLSGAAEKRRVKAGLADGSIGVVVGTGAVAAKGVAYADLALVVIDEEQRFGAADKEKLRGLGAGHVLTLSATPIPRTLQSALVGLQQISVIATPPARRQPIRTSVQTWDDAAIRAALRREHARGGQSFVVVPRIEDMATVAARLERLIPELTLVQAHGKMAAAAIDEAMVGFANGEGDVLLATNIIEAGLDVPRANTMVVHRADRFGLSQLHQLRGRVGRGGRRGQVLLTTEEGHAVAPTTLKRLRTLQAFDRLGAGFAISARDLDLRGAGDLVGTEQAGHMKLIGIDLYQFLVTQALRQARGEPVEPPAPAVNVGGGGRLPVEWIPEEAVRLALYGRLARLRDGGALDAFAEELEDRFGPMPAAAQALIEAARVGMLARDADVMKVDAGPAAIAFTPAAAGDPPLPALEARGGRWVAAERIADDEARLSRIAELLEEMAEARSR